MSTFKKWLPFTVTFVLATGAAIAAYVWKGSEITNLQSEAKGSAITRAVADDAPAPRGKPGAAKSTPKSRLDASLRPTRNGVRNLFARAKRVMEMDREEVEKLLAELETQGRIRSPITGINLMAAYARLAELDPNAAMERALNGKGEIKEMAMFTVMNEWLAGDRRGALAWFAKSEDTEAKKKYLTIAAFTNAGADPDLITELSAAIGDEDARRKAMLDSFGALAFSDPDAALKKLAEIEDPEEREKAEEKVYEGFLMRYPDKALDYALSKPPGDRARDNARQALVRWGEQDAGAALKWLTTQNKDVQKELFDTGDAKNPGWGFGKATVEQISDTARQLTDQTQKDKLYASWANSQAWNQPAQGLNQLSQIKDLELQKATASSMGSSIAQSGNTTAMTTWLETAIPNDTRDTAVASFARGIAQRDAAAGTEWANKITNATIREATLEALKNPPATPQPSLDYRPGRRR